jgi:hypothetical protein
MMRRYLPYLAAVVALLSYPSFAKKTELKIIKEDSGVKVAAEFTQSFAAKGIIGVFEAIRDKLKS